MAKKPQPKRKRGQPTKRTPRTLARLEEALRKGLPRWAACAYAKISSQCFYEWMREQPSFEASVLEWEAAALTELVAGVRKTTPGKMFLLARRFRSDYGDKVEIEHVGGVKVEYVNDWRGPAPDAAPGPEDRPPAGETVQLVGSGPALAQNDTLHVHRD